MFPPYDRQAPLKSQGYSSFISSKNVLLRFSRTAQPGYPAMALLKKRPTMCALATPRESLTFKSIWSIVEDLERAAALQLYRQAAARRRSAQCKAARHDLGRLALAYILIRRSNLQRYSWLFLLISSRLHAPTLPRNPPPPPPNTTYSCTPKWLLSDLDNNLVVTHHLRHAQQTAP